MSKERAVREEVRGRINHFLDTYLIEYLTDEFIQNLPTHGAVLTELTDDAAEYIYAMTSRVARGVTIFTRPFYNDPKMMRSKF